jgi:hypothetical protein
MPEISDEERKREGLKPHCPCKSGNYRTAQHSAKEVFHTEREFTLHDHRHQNRLSVTSGADRGEG